MILVALKEKNAYEKRVSLTPQTVKRYKDMGLSVFIETDAGLAAGFSNEVYLKEGAQLATDDTLKNASFVLCVNEPTEKDIKKIALKAYVIGQFNAATKPKLFKAFNQRFISAFSLELLPRITRAQSMDILSSQANLAGYRSVIEASFYFKRAFPLMMTAAGTIPAARVLILGVGVAGLQAIATAKRLGAIVSAYDVRSSIGEQVKSLGATFIEVGAIETGDGVGGYAKEMSEDYKKAQEERLKDVVKMQDIVITTAQIPAKKAPLLVTKEMVYSMKPGSVIVDLAASTGGNCSLTKPSETITVNDVHILGPLNILSAIAYDASELFSKNMYMFIKTLFKWDNAAQGLVPDWHDDLILGTLITRDGTTVHTRFQKEEKIIEQAINDNSQEKDLKKEIDAQTIGTQHNTETLREEDI